VAVFVPSSRAPPPLTLARKHRTPPPLGLGNNRGPAAGGIAPTPPIGLGVWPWGIRLDIAEVWVAIGGAEGHHDFDNCSPEASIVADPHSTAGRSPSRATLSEMTIPSSTFTSITCCTCQIGIWGRESQIRTTPATLHRSSPVAPPHLAWVWGRLILAVRSGACDHDYTRRVPLREDSRRRPIGI
jgi:hypothetical protein